MDPECRQVFALGANVDVDIDERGREVHLVPAVLGTSCKVSKNGLATGEGAYGCRASQSNASASSARDDGRPTGYE
ncbi:hypothetical protein CVT25_013149 [Psilocybe cyanescens]|uniref:Uncharacterized protein n=1 Tax=Psilocybe cyanescens TaxID=93625 RepID=A0A409XK36_PSICY|nr:hypothetical protein CVT25_013149 [Psilocybe cyanescens]